MKSTVTKVSVSVCMLVKKQFNASLLFETIKGLVHPKMKILSVFTHPHVVSTP